MVDGGGECYGGGETCSGQMPGDARQGWWAEEIRVGGEREEEKAPGSCTTEGKVGGMGSGRGSVWSVVSYTTQAMQFMVSAMALLLVLQMVYRPVIVLHPRHENVVNTLTESNTTHSDGENATGSTVEANQQSVLPEEENTPSNGTEGGTGSEPAKGKEDTLLETGDEKVKLAKDQAFLPAYEEIVPEENWPNRTLIDDVVNSAYTGMGPKRFMVTAVSCNFLDIADNWLASIIRLEIKNFIVIALDSESYARLNAIIPGHVISSPIEAAKGSTTYGSAGFASVVRSRPVLLANLLRLGYHVMYTDVDMVYQSNPFDEFPDGYDLVAPSDSYLTSPPELTWEDKRNICTGLLYLAPTEVSHELLYRWNTRLIRGERSLNQGEFNRALRNMGYQVDDRAVVSRISVHILSKDAFPPGFMYFQNPQWKYKDMWQPSRRPVMIHNNFLQKKENKVKRFKEFDLWRPSRMLENCKRRR